VVAVEPVRVKVYGLLSRTRRRYVLEATVGVVCLVAVMVAWWFGWPKLRQRLVQLELSPAMRTVVIILDAVPWLLLVVAAVKAVEIPIVLRAFARKAAAPPADAVKAP
jgi:hypothetical protein